MGANIWKRREILSHYIKPLPRSDSHFTSHSIGKNNGAQGHTSTTVCFDDTWYTTVYHVFEGEAVGSDHKGGILEMEEELKGAGS